LDKAKLKSQFQTQARGNCTLQVAQQICEPKQAKTNFVTS